MAPAIMRPPRLPALLRPTPQRRPRRPTELTAGHVLAIGAVSVLGVVATAAAAVPVGQRVRDAACGTGPGSCAPELYQVEDLGRCRVISRADIVAQDAVVFADGVEGSEGLGLYRSVDRDGVVTWTVERADERPGLVTRRTFGDRAGADRYALAVTRDAGRSAVLGADGSGVAALLGERIDTQGLDDAPPPTAVVMSGTRLGAGTQGEPRPDPPTPPASSTTPLSVTWYLDPEASTDPSTNLGAPERFERARTVWELDWAVAKALSVASTWGEGRLLMALTQSEDGTPLTLELEAAGRLAARLAPPRSGEAFTDPLSRPPAAADPTIPFVGRLTMTVDLTEPGTRELAAALSERVGAPIFPVTSTQVVADAIDRAANGDDLPTRAVDALSARRAAQYTSTGGLLRAFDRGTAGTAVTLHELRLPAQGPQAVLTGGERLGFAGALPAADYYLTRAAGFVKWQECER